MEELQGEISKSTITVPLFSHRKVDKKSTRPWKTEHHCSTGEQKACTIQVHMEHLPRQAIYCVILQP